MPSKEQYCFQILKEHNLIIDYEGEISNVDSHSNEETIKNWRDRIAEVVGGETLREWKKRVLGNKVKKVKFYSLKPHKTDPNTKISDLQDESGADHIKNIVKAFGKYSQVKKKEATDEVFLKLTTYPKDELDALLKELGASLEPTVKDFFKRFLESKRKDIEIVHLLRDILKNYNSVVGRYREIHDQLNKIVDDIHRNKLTDKFLKSDLQIP